MTILRFLCIKCEPHWRMRERPRYVAPRSRRRCDAFRLVSLDLGCDRWHLRLTCVVPSIDLVPPLRPDKWGGASLVLRLCGGADTATVDLSREGVESNEGFTGGSSNTVLTTTATQNTEPASTSTPKRPSHWGCKQWTERWKWDQQEKKRKKHTHTSMHNVKWHVKTVF